MAAAEPDQSVANVKLKEVGLVARFLQAANNTDVAALERLVDTGAGANEDLVNAVDEDGFSALVRASKLY